MEFLILGPTALRVDREMVPLGPAKQRGLLAVLLFHARTPVRVDTIVEYLWPGHATPDRRAGLYSLASRTRAALGRAGMDNVLVRVPGTGAYKLNIDPQLVDYHRFTRMVDDARRAAGRNDVERSVDILTAALDLWAGEPLADLRGSLADDLRQTMDAALLDANKLLVDGLLATRRHEAALVVLESLARVNNTDETLARHRITALCRAGREAEARSYYTEFRHRFRQVMKAEPAVDPPLAPGRTRGRAGSGPEQTAPNQLPPPIDDYVGHDDLIALLDRLTAGGVRTPVVSISGMPGIGKSTLAFRWANLRRYRFSDGQLYLNANAYGPSPPICPADALARFLHALGVPNDRMPDSVEARQERLRQVLAGRRVLIVLDNVLDSDQVRPLLLGSPTCVVIVTSRNRLRGLMIREGVRNIVVPPLSERESLTLLTCSIGADRAAGERDAMRALARVAGGLPLAVRIVAENIAERPRALIADLVDELSSHLLDGDVEDGDDANLRSMFAWSYEALPPDAARLFRMLGLHPGATVSAEAAAAMVGAEVGPTTRLLNTLAKAHLVNHDTARRFALHDLLRLFAAEQARREEPADEIEAAHRRLLTWYVTTAVNAACALAPHRPPPPDLPSAADVRPETFADAAADHSDERPRADRQAMRWCEAERENILAITRFAVGNGFPRYGWQLPNVLHEVYERYGGQHDVLALQQLALRSARLDRHRIGEMGTLINLGATYYHINDYDSARESFTAALRLSREADDGVAEAVCLHNLATIQLKAGNLATAADLYRTVLDMYRNLSRPDGEASSLHGLGIVMTRLPAADRALRYFTESLAISERAGLTRLQGMTLSELASLYLEKGAIDTAMEHCSRAFSIHSRTHDEGHRCDSLITRAEIRRRSGEFREAILDARTAVELGNALSDSTRRCQALAVLADCLAATGDREAARTEWAHAMATLDELAVPVPRSLRDRLAATRGMLFGSGAGI